MSKKAGTPDPTNIMTPTDDNKPEPQAAAPQAAAPVVDMGPVIAAIESGFQSLDKSVKGIKLEMPKIIADAPKKEEPATPPAAPTPDASKPPEKKYRWFDEFDPF